MVPGSLLLLGLWTAPLLFQQQILDLAPVGATFPAGQLPCFCSLVYCLLDWQKYCIRVMNFFIQPLQIWSPTEFWSWWLEVGARRHIGKAFRRKAYEVLQLLFQNNLLTM